MNSINRNNYEEYFLLYIDGELPEAGKQAVEQFLLTNPDLAAELELLLQLQLTPENLVYPEKESLFRNETDQLNFSNSEEQFLLYVDNELDAARASQVETFVLQNPSLQENFTLLKQTKLEAETIPFPDKSILYRKAERETPVILLRWTRVAVAAALIGLVALVWILAPVPVQPHKELAVTRPTTTPTNETQSKERIENSIHPAEIASNNNRASNQVFVQGKREAEKSFAEQPAVQKDALPVNRNGLLARNEVIPAIDFVPGKTISAFSEPDNQITPAIHVAQLKPDRITENPEKGNTDYAANNLVQPAVYKLLETDDERKSLYLGSLEINKDKLRGLFRKAGNLFRSKTKQVPDEERTEVQPQTHSLD